MKRFEGKTFKEAWNQLAEWFKPGYKIVRMSAVRNKDGYVLWVKVIYEA